MHILEPQLLEKVLDAGLTLAVLPLVLGHVGLLENSLASLARVLPLGGVINSFRVERNGLLLLASGNRDVLEVQVHLQTIRIVLMSQPHSVQFSKELRTGGTEEAHH